MAIGLAACRLQRVIYLMGSDDQYPEKGPVRKFKVDPFRTSETRLPIPVFRKYRIRGGLTPLRGRR